MGEKREFEKWMILSPLNERVRNLGVVRNLGLVGGGLPMMHLFLYTSTFFCIILFFLLGW